MSKYSEVVTEFNDRDCLVDALKEHNFGQGDIEVEIHDRAQRLYDFQGRQTHYLNTQGDVAHVIVRRQFVPGASNDLGFVLKAEGKFAMIRSAYDSRQACSDAWVTALTDTYNEKKFVKEAKKQGFNVKTKKSVNGKTQIVMVR
jgi:hypothetical protein